MARAWKWTWKRTWTWIGVSMSEVVWSGPRKSRGKRGLRQIISQYNHTRFPFTDAIAKVGSPSSSVQGDAIFERSIWTFATGADLL